MVQDRAGGFILIIVIIIALALAAIAYYFYDMHNKLKDELEASRNAQEELTFKISSLEGEKEKIKRELEQKIADISKEKEQEISDYIARIGSICIPSAQSWKEVMLAMYELMLICQPARFNEKDPAGGQHIRHQAGRLRRQRLLPGTQRHDRM